MGGTYPYPQHVMYPGTIQADCKVCTKYIHDRQCLPDKNCLENPIIEGIGWKSPEIMSKTELQNFFKDSHFGKLSFSDKSVAIAEKENILKKKLGT